jgi:hypothetical protein
MDGEEELSAHNVRYLICDLLQFRDTNLPQLHLPTLSSQTSTMASEEAQIICAAAALGAMAATATVTAVVMAIIIDDLENDTDTSDDDTLGM